MEGALTETSSANSSASAPPKLWPVMLPGALPEAQADPSDELHGDEHLALGEHSRFMHGDDVGVRQARQGLRLTQQPLLRAVISRALPGPDQLDGDLALQLLVIGGEHLAHAARPQLLQQHEVAETAGSSRLPLRLLRARLLGRRAPALGGLMRRVVDRGQGSAATFDRALQEA